MPRTDIVTVYRAKGNSETLAIVIPRSVRDSGQIRRGEKFQASLDHRGRIVYRRIERVLD
jgi:hypothetical protein